MRRNGPVAGRLQDNARGICIDKLTASCYGVTMHTIPCPTCNGTKRAPLPAVLAAVLDMMIVIGESTTRAIYDTMGGRKRCGVGITAINNRLVALEELGLVRRRPFGKSALWTATTKVAR